MTRRKSPHLGQNDHSPDTVALYAWLSRDADGIEGTVVVPVDMGFGEQAVPLIFTSRERAERFTPQAQMAAKLRGFTANLVRFDRADIIQTVS